VIQLRSLRADDGTVTDLGGGCGSGGRAQATCAITGHAGFSHWLSEATPSAASLLVLSTRQTALTCGSCTLVADPTAGVAVSTATDNFGEAAVPMPIPASPSLVGVELVEQWLVLGGGGCAGLGFSNAIRLEIE